MTDSCGTCRFWQRVHNETDRGECHRYAPRPAHQWDAFIGEAIIAIADLISRHKDLDWPKDIDGEATETRNSAGFPHTHLDDWCGEFAGASPSHISKRRALATVLRRQPKP